MTWVQLWVFSGVSTIGGGGAGGAAIVSINNMKHEHDSGESPVISVGILAIFAVVIVLLVKRT